MKSPIVLWSLLANEFASRCCTSATRDIETVSGRMEHEGLSFLTITLPSFGKDFQKSLDLGTVDHNLFQGFTWRAGLPQFLGGFLDRVFHRTSGVLRDEPCIEAILAVRQLSLLYSKMLLPCSDARVEAAMSDFVSCDREVASCDSEMEEIDYVNFHRISSLLFDSVLTSIDARIYKEEIIPKHGPGATADKLIGNEKLKQRIWTDRLQEVFSSENFLFPNARFASEDAVTYLDPGSEVPVKVTPVPKTQKTPRIIAIEPTCMQYAQQGILEQLIPLLEKDPIVGSFLGFSDQGPNQVLAKRGSSDSSLATLDLSEASDRVSNQLIRTMAKHHPFLLKGLDATRSRKADVPGHGVIRLSKYASMGSALCFPMEAMVFLTLVFLGIERSASTHFVRKEDLISYMGQVRIYGDDIIVPVEHVHSVIATLEHFGARVGSSKSFWTGRFRESCGKEYYGGHDVSIVKIRRPIPTSPKDAPGCISLIESRNQLYKAGCWETVSEIDSYIRKILKYFPVVEDSSPGLGRASFLGYRPERMCDVLHRPLVKAYVPRAIIPKNSLGEDGALLKFFLKRGGLPSADRNHLERSGRPRAVDIKPRWTVPF